MAGLPAARLSGLALFRQGSAPARTLPTAVADGLMRAGRFANLIFCGSTKPSPGLMLGLSSEDLNLIRYVIFILSASWQQRLNHSDGQSRVQGSYLSLIRPRYFRRRRSQIHCVFFGSMAPQPNTGGTMDWARLHWPSGQPASRAQSPWRTRDRLQHPNFVAQRGCVDIAPSAARWSVADVG